MANDRIAQCYIYTNNAAPEVRDSALHLAAYNGRTDRFRSLLANGHSVYQRTTDPFEATPLQVAICRGHSAIAAICVQQMTIDLALIDRHFARIGGAVYESRFWLRSRLLIIVQPADVQFVRDESADLLANPSEMRPPNQPVRRGLLVLLKPAEADAQVLWLSARHPGDDRRLAYLVARCAQRDGSLEPLEEHIWGLTCFQLTARRNLPELWQQMHAAIGQYALTRREYASCFRLLAEHKPAAGRVAHFVGLCQTLGGFETTELFAEGEALLRYEILRDALHQFNGDMLVLDYLFELAAKEVRIRMQCSRQEAITEVIHQQHPTGESQLLEETYQTKDETLIWQCLRYEPHLMRQIGFYRKELIWTLLDRPRKEYESDLTALIGKQFAGGQHSGVLVDLFRALCKVNFGQAAVLVWSMIPSDLRANQLQFEDLLHEVLRSGQYDAVSMLLRLLPDIDRLRTLSKSLRWDANCPQYIPEPVWKELLAGNQGDWDPEQVGFVLCAALETRQMDVFDEVRQLMGDVIVLKDVCDADRVPILFHAIFDEVALKRFCKSPVKHVRQESLEIIDSEDDELSCERKTAINEQRTVREKQWTPSALIRDEPLKASYRRLFDELIETGANWNLLHPVTGQSLLHVAAARNNLAVAQRLLSLGMAPSSEDTTGNVPMTYVSSVAMIALLPAADVRHVNRNTERTPLGEYLFNCEALIHDVEVVRALVAAGADVNHVDGFHALTPLMMVPCERVAAVLLAAGADVNAVDDQGQTVLYRYRYEQHIELIRLLLRQPGVDLWPRPVDGDSLLLALMRFMPWSELRMVFPGLSVDQQQLERFVGEKVESGLSALSCLQRSRDADDLRCVQQLLELDGCNLNDVSQMWSDNWRRFLVERGAHVSQRLDKSPLDWSKCKRPYDVCNEIEFFASAGFAVDYLEEEGFFRETALQAYCDYYADRWQQVRIVAHLIAAGADYRLWRSDGKSVLDGMVLDCLYEWDGERGLALPERTAMKLEEQAELGEEVMVVMKRKALV